ncbi:hypothetical protein DOY81_005559 [Sarcophaga bullata]|nr:hypothetical protein DOY81_005559 [Sarcophaga bullata]
MDSTPAQTVVQNEKAKDPDSVSRTSAANKAKDQSPARLSVHAASLAKSGSKDASPARMSVKSVNANTAKNSEHSPARASVKSMQATAAATATKEESTKAIPKPGRFNKTLGKNANKNQSKTSLATSIKSQKGSTTVLSKKATTTVLPAASAANPKTTTAKSRIPAMTRNIPATTTPTTTITTTNTTTTTTTQGKAKSTAALQHKNLSTSGKTVTEKSAETKKSLHLRMPPVSLANPHSNTEPETKSPTAATPNATSKSQSARSSSGGPVPGINKRSISNASTRSTPCSRKKDEFETNLRKMCSTAGDQNRIETLEKKLKATQTEFLKEIQNLKDMAPDKLNCEYKFITVIKNDESKLIVKDDELRQLPKKFPAASVNDFKEKLKNHMEQWFSSVKTHLKNSKDPHNSDLIKIKEKLEHLECLKSHDLLSYIDDLCSHNEEDTELKFKKLKSDLEESQKALKKSEKMLNDLQKEHEEQRQKWEKEIKLKQDTDIHKKEQEIKDLHKKLKAHEKQLDLLKISSQTTEKDMENEKVKLIDELTTVRESLVLTTKKLQVAEQQFAQEKRVIKRLENELQEKKKLEESLSEMTAKVGELQAKPKSKDKPCKECIEHLKRINELNSKIETLDAQQAGVIQQKEKLEKELIDQAKLKDKIREMEAKIKDLQKQLEHKAKTVEVIPESSKDAQAEYGKFRQVEAERRREIEKLKTELSKAQFNMCQLEQQIERDQQLLDVRSELINSLQTNEKNHRIHMEELFAQVGEKNNTITELNAELQAKSEEFRNLITNLSAKQMELVNQEHIIKLLEESNERSQMLRVKQEEKIGRMEEELAHLKQTISIYQGNILAGNGNKQLLFAPIPAPTSPDYNQNFYYYASQRKRKRQVDINVKKYEA